MNIIDPYYKKTISYRFDTFNLQFKLSQDLFSSQEVDHGTQRLLRTLLFEHINTFNKALDLGSGYGPIGIILKKICPKADVHMVDRDALALEYSQANAQLNNITEPFSVYGSLGYDSVKDTDFDLIVSNIPGKVGNQVLTHMIKDARFHLVKNGRVIIVVIDAIADYIHQELTTDENIEILYHRAWPGHHVYHYKFTETSYKDHATATKAFERGEYKRQKNIFRFQDSDLTIDTTFHLPEFDSLSYDSQILLSNLDKVKGSIQNALIFNPGQGYIPLAIVTKYQPKELFLVDRDLQALTISKENLIAHGYTKNSVNTYHQVGIDIPDQNIDSIIGILPEQQSLEVYKLTIEQAAKLLPTNGCLILSSSSTVITRIEELISKKSGFIVLDRERNKGRSFLLLQKK